MGRIRYIGSKARIVEKILDHCGLPNGGWFLDVFSGTGVVSREAAIRGWRIRANDHLLSASILTIAKILSVDDVPFLEFGGYQNAIKDLNYALPRPGFIYKEYT
ncbi:MAG: DNA adenine methylase, partial [Desulfobaccales bacterium]